MDSDVCFQELSAIDPSEWTNIPPPVVKSIKVLKKCISLQLQSIKDNNQGVMNFNRTAESQLAQFDFEINNIKTLVISAEENYSRLLKDTVDSAQKSQQTLQKSITSEVEYLKKHTEGKFAFLDIQFASLKTSMSTLPTYEILDTKLQQNIRENSSRLRKEIREDIKYTIVDPEIHALATNLESLSAFVQENVKNTSEELSKINEELQRQNQENEHKFNVLMGEIDEIKQGMEKIILDLDTEILKINQKVNEFKKYVGNVEGAVNVAKNKLKKHRKAIKGLRNDQESYETNIKNLQDDIRKIDSKIQLLDDIGQIALQQKVYESTPMPQVKYISENPIANEEKNIGKGQESKIVHHEATKKFVPEMVQPGYKEPDFTRIFEEIQKTKLEIEEKMEKANNLNKTKINSMKITLENGLKNAKSSYSEDLTEIKEKLYWLPVNLKDIKGMNPTEARIFILEARMRSEENIRNEQYHKLLQLLDGVKVDLKNTSENIAFSSMLPSINSVSYDSRTPDIRSGDYAKKLTDSIRTFDSPERIKAKMQRQARVSMSVELGGLKSPFKRKL